jgi:hypothetical protein
MTGTSEEENVTLTVTETESTSNTLSSDDLIALTELIHQESSTTNEFNYQGIIIGSSLLGAGILFSIGTVISSHSSFNKYKNKTIVNKLFSSLAIPLTTTGIALTTFFVLNRNKHKSSY